MNKIFHIVNGSFHANLDPEHMHEMLLSNWRKMVRLAVADWRNEDTLRELNEWFTQRAQSAQQEWKIASQVYVNGWKDPKNHGREARRRKPPPCQSGKGR
jgi:hypothetical protein|nr:MAG TPA: hypothetical protein [Caudoviricetes sp.]